MAVSFNGVLSAYTPNVSGTTIGMGLWTQAQKLE